MHIKNIKNSKKYLINKVEKIYFSLFKLWILMYNIRIDILLNSFQSIYNIFLLIFIYCKYIK